MCLKEVSLGALSRSLKSFKKLLLLAGSDCRDLRQGFLILSPTVVRYCLHASTDLRTYLRCTCLNSGFNISYHRR